MAYCPSVETENSLITPDAAARRLRISTSTLKRMRLRGDGPPVLRITGRTLRYPLFELENWLAKQAEPIAS
jgi:predicted DNA-binding transcriptional regulator AlpA